MPFIPQIRRSEIDRGSKPDTQGERCYYWYRYFRDMWNKKPQWNTADLIYKVVKEPGFDYNDQIAKELAWQVFFARIVLKYEEQKAWENGDII